MIDQAKKLRQMVRDTRAGSARSPVTHGANGKKGVHKTSACRSIAVTSGKGGVGKSHTTISLAVALTRLKKKVVVFDGDLGLANIHIMLGIAPKYNLSHVIREECSLQEIVCTGPAGITIIPGASGILSMANLESLRLESLIRELTNFESAYDFLKNLNDQINLTGSIFDPPPTFIRGNIQNDEDPDDIILGYFIVAGTSKIEIAVDRSIPENAPTHYATILDPPLYCGDPCDFVCVTMAGGICGLPPCPPACNNLPYVTYQPPDSWPLDENICDE